MKKNFLVLMIVLFGVSGCAGKSFEFSDFINTFEEEFPIVQSTEIVTEQDDEFLNVDGYYTKKVVMRDENNKELINIELFDNQVDLSNRIDYLTAAITKGRKQFYEDLQHITGGYRNIENISKSLGTIYLEEEHLEQVGPLLLRFPKSNRYKYDYIEFIENYLEEYNLEFTNQNKNHYDIEKEIASIPDIRDVVQREFEKLYGEIASLNRELIEEVLNLEGETAIKYFNNTINIDVFGKIPLFLENFATDDSFQDVHKHIETSKEKVREKEALEKQAKKEKDKRKKEEEKIKKEKIEKESKINTEETYVKELSKIFNDGDLSGSHFTVTRETFEGESVIKIVQKITDEDLKLAMGLNLVEGEFKEETKYMLDNLRNTINTTVKTNPTERAILYLIQNPFNSDNYVYFNFNGAEFHNDFQE